MTSTRPYQPGDFVRVTISRAICDDAGRTGTVIASDVLWTTVEFTSTGTLRQLPTWTLAAARHTHDADNREPC